MCARCRRRLYSLILPVLTIGFLLPVGCTPAGQSGAAPSAGAGASSAADRLHAESLRAAVVGHAALQNYVQRVGDRLAEAAPQGRLRGVRFHLVAGDTHNAFATGPHVYVYNALLQECKSEEDLAAVVAHQLAHLAMRGESGAGWRADPRGTLDQIVLEMARQEFNRGEEKRADRLAFDIYTRAGWDPAKFTVIWRLLRDRGLDDVGAGRASLSARIETAGPWAGDLPPDARDWLKAPLAEGRGFERILAAARTASAAMAVPPNTQLYLRALPNCVLPADPDRTAQARQELLRRNSPKQEVEPV